MSQSKASPQQRAAGFVTRAIGDFSASGANMLLVRTGDLVEILEQHATGWSFCRLTSQPDVCGWAPAWVAPIQQGREALVLPAAAEVADKGQAPAAVVEAPEKHQAPAPTTVQAACAVAEPPRPAPHPQQALSPAVPTPAPAKAAPLTVASAAPAPATANQVCQAVAAFAATSPSQISLAQSDLVQVIERHVTGWTYGRKVSSTDASEVTEGWFPAWVCPQ